MEINDCIEFCKRNISVDLQQIILIHMSEKNLDANQAVEKIKKHIPYFDNLCYAKVGQIYNIENTLF